MAEFTLWLIWNVCVIAINRYFHPAYSVDEFIKAHAVIILLYFSAGNVLYWATGGIGRGSLAHKFLCYFAVMFFFVAAVSVINEMSSRADPKSQHQN
ncbi:hypothetical protein [Chthoniobacter flavus]|uniref:hypothetical protein n=1 Tax=Chthoniobacter flavus TaxID=191863 RepID=UPI001052BEE9|nr:hypothetical protein [Chthoniobacter flavus]